MILLSSFSYLLSFSLLSTLFTHCAGTHLAFFLSPGDLELISTFTVLSEALRNAHSYTCTIIVHSIDEDAFMSSNCTKLIYGTRHREALAKSLSDAYSRFDTSSLSAITTFNSSYKIFIDDFYEANLMDKVKKLGLSALVCDAYNALCHLVSKNSMNMKPIYYWPTMYNPRWISLMGAHPSVHPMPNSWYFGEMSMLERFMNHVNYIKLAIVTKYQDKIARQHLATRDEVPYSEPIYTPAALYISQDVPGFSPIANLAHNFIRMGCTSCGKQKALPTSLQKFTEKYKKIVFVKTDRIRGYSNTHILLETFHSLEDVGFIVKGNLARDVDPPINVFKADSINSVDVLTLKKVTAFMNDGDYTSVIEGAYYKKPMVVLSLSYDRRMIGKMVVEKGLGVCISDESEYNEANLERLISEVVNDNKKYVQALSKASLSVRSGGNHAEFYGVLVSYIHGDMGSFVVRQGYEMSKVEYFNVDVVVIIVWMAAGGLVGLWFLGRNVVRKVKEWQVKNVGKRENEVKKVEEIRKEDEVKKNE